MYESKKNKGDGEKGKERMMDACGFGERIIRKGIWDYDSLGN